MTLLERRRALMSQNKEPYVFVEYIQSTGQEWIDTGIYPDGNTTLSADYQYTSYSSTSSLVGVRGDGSSNYQSMYVLWVRNNNLEISHDDLLNVKSVTADTKRHLLERNKGTIYIDGKYAIGFAATVTFTSPYTLEVFACNNNGAKGAWCSKMKLYSLKIYTGGTNVNNSTLVRDFVPCYRKADRVAGLYDTVSGEFFENQGTGEFLIGGEI